jgi:aspartate/methionine/tyrosine aminotransferase
MDYNSYLPVQGLESLRESISNHYNKLHNISVDKNDVIIGPGSKTLLCFLNLSIDKDLYIIAPYWVSYYNQMNLFNKKCNVVRTIFENKWKIKPNQIRIMNNDSYLLINNPNNPTGMVYTYSEMKEIVSICKEKNITIIADEIYQYLYYKNNKGSHSFLELYPENTIITNGLSKWCHSGGYRLGYMIIPNNNKLSILKSKILSCCSETFSCVNNPLQRGSIEVFNNFNDIIEYNKPIIRCFDMYSNFFYNSFIDMKIKVHKSEGAYYMFLNFENYRDLFKKNNINDSFELCNSLIKDIQFVMLPGMYFGVDGYYTRFSMVNIKDSDINKISKSNINAMSALEKWLNNL